MTWLIFAICVLGVLLYLAPVFLDQGTPETDQEVQAYFAQIDALERRDDLSEAEIRNARLGLERQILKRRDAKRSDPSPRLAIALFLIVILCGGGLYAGLGAPFYKPTPQAASLSRGADPGITEDLADLLAQLEARTGSDLRDDPQAWLYYARTLLAAGRYDEALIAYDRLIELTDGDPEPVAERDRARQAIAEARNPRGPRAEDIEAADAMNETERQAMIQAMVDGLSERLRDSPENPAGWVRLIRARIVLGQTETAQAEIDRLRAVYVEQPEVVDQILRDAGWKGEGG